MLWHDNLTFYIKIENFRQKMATLPQSLLLSLGNMLKIFYLKDINLTLIKFDYGQVNLPAIQFSKKF